VVPLVGFATPILFEYSIDESILLVVFTPAHEEVGTGGTGECELTCIVDEDGSILE
jgi:hypothetical protein